MFGNPQTEFTGDASRPDVVKLGGSLFDLEGLPGLVHGLRRAGRTTIIVPGGGPVVDGIRSLHPAMLRQRGDMPAAAIEHRVSLLACDATAEWTAGLLGMPRIGRLSQASDVCVASASLGIDPAPIQNWSTTSDTLSLMIAHSVGAARLTLLKSVGPFESLDAAVAAGALDDVFPRRVEGMPVRWLNLRSGESADVT